MAMTIIGIMGPGDGARQKDLQTAHDIGRLIAEKGWVVLTGGRNTGVMEAAGKGAKEQGGITVGILPDEDSSRASRYVDIPIRTGMGSARNNINVLSSDVVIACGTGVGTTSEIMLALKAGKRVILIHQSAEASAFFESLHDNRLYQAASAGEAVSLAEKMI